MWWLSVVVHAVLKSKKTTTVALKYKFPILLNYIMPEDCLFYTADVFQLAMSWLALVFRILEIQQTNLHPEATASFLVVLRSSVQTLG
jgi:hypothetical protein